MLRWRLAVSALLIPSLIGLFWLDARLGAGAWILLVLSLLLAWRSAWELVQLMTVRAMAPSLPLAVAGSLAVVLSGWHQRLAPTAADDAASTVESLGAVAATFLVVVLVLLFAAALKYRAPGNTMESLAGEIFIVVYAGLLLAATAQLRWVLLPATSASYLALASVVIAAKSGDIGAYTLGRMFGKRKMAPLLSPGKTWMGAVGAVLFSGLGGGAWLRFGPSFFGASIAPPAWHWAVLYSVAIGVVGLIGDLCESLIKRDVGKKDAPALFPGFGGLLDLLDSVLYAGPVAFLLWRILPLAG